MGQHRAPDPEPKPTIDVDAFEAFRRHIGRLVVIQAGINLLVAGALVSGPAGTAPSLAFLRLVMPLGVWAMAFGAVGVLLFLKQFMPAHTLGVVVWVFLAAGAVIGLVTGSTGSPAGSLVLTGLVLGMATLHCNALWFRRGEQRAGRL